MMTRTKLYVLLICLFSGILLVLAGCAGAVKPEVTKAPPAATAEPSQTPAPTPEPTPTAEPQATPFSFAWMSDTQEYAANHNDIFCDMTEWIAKSQAEWNTVLTIHTGDIIRGSYKDYQWENMKTAFALLPDGMKIVTVGGNHDIVSYWDQYTPYLDNRPDTDFSMENAFDDKGYVYYTTFTEGGVPFIVFSITYGYEREAVDWLNATLKQFSDHYAILCFHSYLDPGGYSSVGRRLIESVVEPNPNVRVVLCGHEPGTAYLPAEFDDDGDGTPDRTVFQMMFNLQHEDGGGDGYLRILRFDPVNDTIEVVTYSPYLDVYGFHTSGGDDFGESKLLEHAGLSAFVQP